MYVPHNGYWRRNVDYIAFLHKKFLCLCTYCLDHGVGEALLLIQTLYTFVQIDAGCIPESVSLRHAIPEQKESRDTYMEGQAS